jgi:hypothetical protein
MSTLNERFVRIFEEMKSEINRLAGRQESYEMQLDLAAERSRQVARHRSLLRYVRDVRNAIQHPRHATPGHAVLISENFLKEVEGVLNSLKNPPRARTMCIPVGSLFTASLSSRIGNVAEEMRRRRFSHVPILDERRIVLGVFNEAAIFDYFWTDEILDASRDIQIAGIINHCKLDAGHTEVFDFVRPSTTQDELIAAFTGIKSESARVGAIFVTPSGTANEPITGMLTPWDVLRRANSD